MGRWRGVAGPGPAGAETAPAKRPAKFHGDGKRRPTDVAYATEVGKANVTRLDATPNQLPDDVHAEGINAKLDSFPGGAYDACRAAGQAGAHARYRPPHREAAGEGRRRAATPRSATHWSASWTTSTASSRSSRTAAWTPGSRTLRYPRPSRASTCWRSSSRSWPRDWRRCLRRPREDARRPHRAPATGVRRSRWP